MNLSYSSFLTLVACTVCDTYCIGILNVKKEKLLIAARPLKMKLVDYDGGSLNESSTAANVLLTQDSSIGTLL